MTIRGAAAFISMCQKTGIAMIPTVEKCKISPKSTKFKLKGTVLEIVRETATTQDHHSIDMSKFDMYLTGVDSDGFVIFEIKPTEKPVFDLSRKRMHGDYIIPSDFYEYLRHITSENTVYTVFRNAGKHFLIRVETPKGIRIHNLGQLDDPKSYLGRFVYLFERWGEWLHRSQIKTWLHKERMYDGQKMTICLLILHKEGIIKRQDGVYAHHSLTLDTGVVSERAEDQERKEIEAIGDSLELPSSLSCS